ncbi:hypothetical protein AHMF7605_10595 [Adhaeribacter arboris]|uniref:Uncharacterized protein n=1 Tax=Adhaeribacter arboris TaxID=2072846 RepID=A0A2T2YEJ1_9BACT|nr:hypothetical protein [Adhaeribacter arboris]PSR53935.1 hypothetical protein AHMF7605_10595 [Adhaeribacter arboris]
MPKNEIKTSNSGFPYKPARLAIPKNSAGQTDLTKTWYISYYIFSEITGKLERQRKEGEINSYKTIADRKTAGKQLVDDINLLLQNDYIIQKPNQEPENTSLETNEVDSNLPFG